MVLLSTLVLPEEVVLIPKFLMFNIVPRALFGYALIDTWWPLIMPSWFGGGAFYVFLLRQFFMQIPRELDEAAKIDGANSFQILCRVLLPLAGPALATVAIFAFLAHWNDFIHPLIYLNTHREVPALARPALLPAAADRRDRAARAPADGRLAADDAAGRSSSSSPCSASSCAASSCRGIKG